MATVNGTNYAKIIDPSSDNILSGGLNGGRVRVAVDDYTFAGSASGTVVNIAKLPAGARVLKVEIITAALGTGVTLGIGYGLSGVEFLGQTAAATAGLLQSNLLGDYVVGTAANDEIITVTTGGASATGKITTHVYYTTD